MTVYLSHDRQLTDNPAIRGVIRQKRWTTPSIPRVNDQICCVTADRWGVIRQI